MEIILLFLIAILFFILLRVFDVETFISASIVIIVTILAFSFLPNFKEFRENYSVGSNALLTFAATLVGVYLAVSYAIAQEAKKEITRKEEEKIQLREKHINILKAIKNDFYLAHQSIEDTDRGPLPMMKLEEGKPFKNADQKLVTPPSLFSEYLKQDYILTLIDDRFINDFLSLHRNALNAYLDINKMELKTVKNFRLKKEVATVYTQMFMWYVDMQISAMRGELNDEEISKRMFEYRQWHNESLRDLGKRYQEDTVVSSIPPPNSPFFPRKG